MLSVQSLRRHVGIASCIFLGGGLCIAARPAGLRSAAAQSGQAVARQQPTLKAPSPVQASAQGPGSAGVAGRIVDAATGAPVYRAKVTARSGPVDRAVTTDVNGAYTILGLPAGHYSVTASKDLFVPRSYGQTDKTRLSSPVSLDQDELLRGVDIALLRTGVITGFVFDANAQPLVRATVQAWRQSLSRGKRRLVPTQATDQTDDRGAYRLYGLDAGDYVVAISQWLPPDPSGGGEGSALRPAPTYYPGTADVAQAIPVRVEAQAEASADFQAVNALFGRIRGSVVWPDGLPAADVSVRARSAGQDVSGAGAAGAWRSARSHADGTFELQDVAPGDYVLTAVALGPMTGERTPPPQPTHQGEARVLVDGQVPTFAAIRLSVGGTMRGKVISDDGSSLDLRDSHVLTVPFDPDTTGGGAGVADSARLGPDGRFEFGGQFGPRCLVLLSPPPGGWLLAAVKIGTRDLTREPIEVASGERATVELILSRTLPEVRGQITNKSGGMAPGGTVVLFGADSAQCPSVAGGRIRVARADQYGFYSVKNLLPGEYVGVAVEDLDTEMLGDNDQLELLRSGAPTIKLSQGSKAVLDLSLPKR